MIPSKSHKAPSKALFILSLGPSRPPAARSESPELALLGQVVALSKLLLSDRAAQQDVAVLVETVGEVLAGEADASSFPALLPSVR